MSLVAALLLAGAATPQALSLAERPRVAFDRHSLLIDGKPTLIWSSEFHPFRLPSPDLWRDILQKMKASGFNTVAIYIDWGFHSPKKGVYDFTGIRDVERVLIMAREEGLYVITRAGPYVNAELSRGGFPGWLVNQPGKARTDDPEYLAAADEWLDRINPIIARHQLGRGGTVILHQIENELALTTPAQSRYMQHLYDKARADGITVPIFHNDQGRNGYWVPKSSGVPLTVTGPQELYAFDGYPGGVCGVDNVPTKGAPAPDWGLYGPGGAKGGASASPHTPGFIAEFGGGWFDYWGSNGMYPCNAVQRGTGYQRVFYGTNIANGIAIQSIYMGYGGTSWGWLPAPVVYTSYDYGSAIDEARNLRPKALELKQLGQFLAAVPDLARLEKAPPVTVTGSDAVQVYHDRNPDTDARLLFVAPKPSNATSDARFTITADLPDGRYSFASELHGRDAKLLVAGVDLERQRLVYSTSELQTTIRHGAEDVALFYGRTDEPGETVLRYASPPKVTVLEGRVASAFDPAKGDLRLTYAHRGLARVRITGGGRPPLLLLIGDVAAAQRFFRQDGLLERGPTLVRHATPNRGTLDLTGDSEDAEPLEVWAPPGIRTVRWNGKAVPVSHSASGSLVALRPLPAPQRLTLPDLTSAKWRHAPGSPETGMDFDDTGWTVAGTARNVATIRPPTGQPNLGADAYGFHDGDVWYRGRFTGSADAQTATVHYGAGGAGIVQLFLDGTLIGQHELAGGLPRPITTGVAEFILPRRAQAPGEHVLAAMVRVNGHNWDLDVDDAHKEPRGLISVSLARPGGKSFAVPIAWRIQGRAGGEDLRDVARGPSNNGGLYGERMGWTLPGFADEGWQAVTLTEAKPHAGTDWYRTTFDLSVPSGEDVTLGLQIGDADTPRSPGRYRVLIFVNGWNMGQFVANVGPQRVFPIPEGILRHRGRNTLALAVTSDGAPGNVIEPVRLVTLHHARGGVAVTDVAAPAYRDLYPTP
ncbi:beta-galactosidase GanA [Sphingomonas sp. SORGH_AS870]|uniref:beta-galactosidase n=1 Tax=Sphingomonas sp. SORGH_AS_0870 TaxID=3041801 RepID=UPI00285C1DAD|nr:beta-galactosidase [Sphingomonas sp. SORGH_AS_0870]MDR6146439.1 beta-galactosidase GanA [Sphingomonas sp. SORGH_AS_0870]